MVWEQFRLPIPPHTIPTHHIALYQPSLVACVCSATIPQKNQRQRLKKIALVLFKETGVWRQSFWAVLAPSCPTQRLWFHEGFPRQYNTKPRNQKDVWEHFRLPIPTHTIPTHHIALYQPALVACVCSATIPQKKTKTTL